MIERGGGKHRATMRCRTRAKTSDDDDDDDESKELMMLQKEFTAFAIELAEAANEETLKYWRKTSLGVETKNDASPVTVADKNAETAMRTLVKRRYPSHAIFGEEHGIELGLEKKATIRNTSICGCLIQSTGRNRSSRGNRCGGP